MNIAAKSCVLLASVLLINAAPTFDSNPVPEGTVQELQRIKRSDYNPAPYGAPSYIVPQCGGNAPAPYHMNIAPHGPAYGYPVHALPSPYAAYGMPHYRAEDFAEEHETFNEMEHGDHFAKMRSYGSYDGAAAAAAAAGSSHIALSHLNAPIATGPALGLFSGANTGGCNVPLLLSCSPSVVPGRLIKSGSHYTVAPAAAPAPTPVFHYSAPTPPATAPMPAYRETESIKNNQEEHHIEPATYDHHEPSGHDTIRTNPNIKHS